MPSSLVYTLPFSLYLHGLKRKSAGAGQNLLRAGATQVEIIIICEMYDVAISASEGRRSCVSRFILHVNLLLCSLLLSGC